MADYKAPGYPHQSAYPPPQSSAYPPAAQPYAPQPQPTAYAPPQGGQPYPAQPPPAYYQPQVAQQSTQATVVVQQQPVVTVAPNFRDYPVTVTDSNGQQVQTVLQYRAGVLTWLIAGVIFILLLELGLCWLAFIPFLIKETKDVYHITPTDGKVVGIYKRLS